jgi:hypothetical protein
MACKDKCCCPVKRRPAKKRKSTVGKVSATQLLAQSIASLALPRKVNEVFLYGNSPLGEAQKFYKSEYLVGPAVAVPPSPAVVKPPVPKPAKYSRQQIQPVPARAEQIVEEPKGRFAERTQFFNTIGKTSNVATPIENVSKPSASERKSYKSMTDFKPVEQLNTISGSRDTLLDRTPQELPTLRNLNDDKFFKELTTRQKYPIPSITNIFNPNLPKPETLKQIIKTPIVTPPKNIFIPSLPSIKENVLYGTKSGTTELMPIAGGGAGMGGRPKNVEKAII